MNLKPKPTRIYGIDVRSRLEARWVVFYEHSQLLRWEYEPGKFDLFNGSSWYPDFRFIRGDQNFESTEAYWYHEVKPVPPTEAYVNGLFALKDHDFKICISYGQFFQEETPMMMWTTGGRIAHEPLDQFFAGKGLLPYYRCNRAIDAAKSFRFDLPH